VKIPQNIQALVRQRANFLCEYCHSPEFLSTAPLTIDHLTPQSLGGADDIENLALACRRCNERRYNFTTGIDPETQKESPLFHPHQKIWAEHFIWTADKLRILGLSALGRATCERLDINDDRIGLFRSLDSFGYKVAGIHPMMTHALKGKIDFRLNFAIAMFRISDRILYYGC
jgi:HNH endonuclease